MSKQSPLEIILGEILNEDHFLDEPSREEYRISQIEALLNITKLAGGENDRNQHYESLQDYGYNACAGELGELLKKKTKSEVEFIPAKLSEEGRFSTSSKNTKISQRETLETTIENLCHTLEIYKVEKVFSSDMSDFYKPEGFKAFQSASNTILDLSRRIAFRNILTKVKSQPDPQHF